MINFLNHIIDLDLIKIKLDVPQVGAKIINYQNLSELKENYLYDFVIDKYGYLRIGRGHYKLNNKEKNLYFAGRLKIENNLISYIDNDSGHYYPTELELMKLIFFIKPSKYISNNLDYKYINLDSFFNDLF